MRKGDAKCGLKLNIQKTIHKIILSIHGIMDGIHGIQSTIRGI